LLPTYVAYGCFRVLLGEQLGFGHLQRLLKSGLAPDRTSLVVEVERHVVVTYGGEVGWSSWKQILWRIPALLPHVGRGPVRSPAASKLRCSCRDVAIGKLTRSSCASVPPRIALDTPLSIIHRLEVSCPLSRVRNGEYFLSFWRLAFVPRSAFSAASTASSSSAPPGVVASQSFAIPVLAAAASFGESSWLSRAARDLDRYPILAHSHAKAIAFRMASSVCGYSVSDVWNDTDSLLAVVGGRLLSDVGRPPDRSQTAVALPALKIAPTPSASPTIHSCAQRPIPRQCPATAPPPSPHLRRSSLT